MATLQNGKSLQVRPVPARMLVGRASSCALRLEARHVSGEHATLAWTEGRWELRDLGSRNGTWVDGRRLAAGEAIAVPVGATLAFGDPGETWVLLEGGPPAAIAEELRTGALRTARDGILALPSDETPEVVVYADSAGRWLVEVNDSEPRRIDAELVLQAGGGTWRVHVPEQQVGTAAVSVSKSIEAVALRFAVSRDEEHVQVTILYRGDEIALEAREHWYALLTLARQRTEDAALPPSEQGWIERDDLLKMLGLDSNALNVAIYRARRQLQAAGVEGAAGVVEVRRGQRRIGLTPDRLDVRPL
jgi:hypothetical protein